MSKNTQQSTLSTELMKEALMQHYKNQISYQVKKAIARQKKEAQAKKQLEKSVKQCKL